MTLSVTENMHSFLREIEEGSQGGKNKEVIGQRIGIGYNAQSGSHELEERYPLGSGEVSIALGSLRECLECCTAMAKSLNQAQITVQQFNEKTKVMRIVLGIIGEKIETYRVERKSVEGWWKIDMAQKILGRESIKGVVIPALKEAKKALL